MSDPIRVIIADDHPIFPPSVGFLLSVKVPGSARSFRERLAVVPFLFRVVAAAVTASAASRSEPFP
ncbi:hypothetical protein [Nonomuraea sp. NPDC003709]|uniref:hypothetical protein n=1 Tax=Nonomuraea sp. NPDC003709 TaxID=3154450 RepID=UPI0033B26C48